MPQGVPAKGIPLLPPATRYGSLICSRQTPSFEARVFRYVPEAGERTEDDEGIEVHGRAEGVHHPTG